jgi:hypothetical protein
MIKIDRGKNTDSFRLNMIPEEEQDEQTGMDSDLFNEEHTMPPMSPMPPMPPPIGEEYGAPSIGTQPISNADQVEYVRQVVAQAYTEAAKLYDRIGVIDEEETPQFDPVIMAIEMRSLQRVRRTLRGIHNEIERVQRYGITHARPSYNKRPRR